MLGARATILLAAALLSCKASPGTGSRGTNDSTGEAGGGGGTGGSAGSGGNAVPDLRRFEAKVDGDPFPFVLSRDESRVIYGQPVEGSFTGSLRVLGDGADPPEEIDPGALVGLPNTGQALRDESLVLPGPDGANFVFRLPQDPPPDDWVAPWPSTVMEYQAGLDASLLVAPLVVHGPWATVPGSHDVLYFDGFGNLFRGTPGSRRRLLVSGVVVQGGETFEALAALSPDGSALVVRGSGGVHLVDLSTNTSKLIDDVGSGPVPVFSEDGKRLALTDPTAVGVRLVLLDVASLEVVDVLVEFAVVLSPDQKTALVIPGPWPAPVALHTIGDAKDVPLANEAAGAGFTSDGRWIWSIEGPTLRMRKITGGVFATVSSPCGDPQPRVLGNDAWVLFHRCIDPQETLVAHRMGTAEELDLGSTGVLAVAPDAGSVLLATSVPPSSWRLLTWDTATGRMKDRGTYGYVHATPDGHRAVGALPGLHVLDPFGNLDVELDAADPHRWLIGNRRAAWTDGSRVALSDLP